MFLDEMQFKELDLDFIFDRIQVDTPYGEIEKRNASPVKRQEIEALEREFEDLEKVIKLLNDKRYEFLELKSVYKNMKQLGSTYERLEAEETLSVTELFEFKVMAMLMRQAMGVMERIRWNENGLRYGLKPVLQVVELLDPEKTGTQSFYIYNAYSESLREIRRQMDRLKAKLATHKASVQEMLNEKSLKIRANGEVHVSKTNAEQVEFAKSCDALAYQSEMPTMIIYRVEQSTDVLEEVERLTTLEEEEEYRVRTELSLKLREHLNVMIENSRKIGKTDYLIARANFSRGFDCVRPKINLNGHILIKAGRHLKVAHRLSVEKKAYTPVDVDINSKVTLITGANMGGKTVSLKMIGLIVAMAHYGIFVPCKSADVGLFDFMFISVGDSQSIDMGLSTFGGEIHKIGKVLKHVNMKGFILIDELARGTNPMEGYAISHALIDHLTQSDFVTVITTHYDGLTLIEGVDHYQVLGLSGVDFENLSGEKGMMLLHELMDYRLSKVSSITEIPKDAIRISEFMGLDAAIINKAKELLGGSNGE